MKSLHTEIGIGANADIVWRVISDFENWDKWNPVIKIDGQLRENGSVNLTVPRPGGDPMEVSPVITFLDEGREFHWTVNKFLGSFKTEHGFRVVPEDTGRCRFENFETFSGPLAVAMFSKQEKVLKTGFEAMNRMLKRECEKQAREEA